MSSTTNHSKDKDKKEGWFNRLANKRVPSNHVDSPGRLVSPNKSRLERRSLSSSQPSLVSFSNCSDGSKNEESSLPPAFFTSLLALYSSNNLSELIKRLKFEIAALCVSDLVAIRFVDYIAEHLFNVDDSNRKLSDIIPFAQSGFLLEAIKSRRISVTSPCLPGEDQYVVPEGLDSGGSEMHRVVVPVINEMSSQACVLIILSRHSYRTPFTEHELKMLNDVCPHIAVAHENAIRFSSLENKVKEHQMLQNITKSLYKGGAESKQIVPKILRHASTYLGADRCSLFMLDKTCNELYSEEFDVSNKQPNGRSVNRSKTLAAVHRELSSARSTRSKINVRNERQTLRKSPAKERSPEAVKARVASTEDIIGNLTESIDQPPLNVRFSTKLGVAGYVVQTGETVNITDAYSDPRFNQEIDKELNYQTRTILCTPVRHHSGEVIGVVQLVNKKQGVFTDGDAEWFENYVVVCNMALLNAFVSELEERRKFEKDTILQTAAIIAQPFDMVELLKRITTNARNLVGANLCSIFLIEEQQLVRQVCDCDKKEITKFALSRGIAGEVVNSGEPIINSNASAHPKFDHDVDQRPGYRTQSIICLPIKQGNEVTGVLSLFNKKSRDGFTPEDVSQIETLTNIIGISIQNAIQYELAKKAESQSKIAFEIIHYHTHFKTEEIDEMSDPLPPELLENSENFKFNSRLLDDLQMCTFVIRMYQKLCLIEKYEIDEDTLKKFILTVRNNYREIPYHNWPHAFSVAHTFYAIAIMADLNQYFEPHEIFAQLTACLVHDIDHRGKNNAFLKTNKSELTGAYGDKSILEHHHYRHFKLAVSQPGLDITENCTEQERKDIFDHIKFTILSTDLAQHFGVLKEFKGLFIGENKIPFDIKNQHHRQLLSSILMTCCDISAISKPWDIHKTVTGLIYEEFFQQGDEEKISGSLPIEMMDRDRVNIPKSQLGFIDFVCLPAYKALAEVIPKCQPLVDGILENREKWAVIVENQAKQDTPKDGPVYLPTL